MSKKRKNNRSTDVPKTNNYVAKYATEFCKAVVHRCKKKDMKRGFQKHKGHSDLYSII